MSASEVSPNPFWYAKLTAALTSRDRLSICVLVMFAHKSVNQLNMTKISKPVKHWGKRLLIHEYSVSVLSDLALGRRAPHRWQNAPKRDSMVDVHSVIRPRPARTALSHSGLRRARRRF